MTRSSLLSEREREVASLLLQGKGNKQIAAALDVTVRTVEFHLSNIYNKLEVASRTEAVLKLAEIRLRKSTGVIAGEDIRESTVDVGSKPSENGDKPISRRIPMKTLPYIAGGSLLIVVLIVGLVLAISSAQVADYHSDEEIAQEAIESAARNLSSTEMEITTDDPVQIGTVVLNQFLKKFRQRETHYAIRLISYEIAEIDFVEKKNDQLYYTSIIKVVPQDKTRFTKILDGVFPYEETEGEIVIFLRFTVLWQDSTYKLVDIDSEENRTDD